MCTCRYAYLTQLQTSDFKGLFSSPFPFQVEFMKAFGYLETGPEDSEALYSEDAIVEAIRSVQKFGGLEQSGKLDEKTTQVLRVHLRYVCIKASCCPWKKGQATGPSGKVPITDLIFPNLHLCINRKQFEYVSIAVLSCTFLSIYQSWLLASR